MRGPGARFPLSVIWDVLPVRSGPISFYFLYTGPRTEPENGVCWGDTWTCTCKIIFVVYGVESFSQEDALLPDQGCER